MSLFFCILATTFSFKELPKNEQLRRLYDSKDDWYFINSIFLYLKKMNPDSDKNDLAKFLFHITNFFNYLGPNNNSVKKNLWSNQRQFYISTKNERQTKENSPKTVKTLSEKSHKCHICFKEFARGSSLSNHLVIHKNDKVFQCRRCNSKFLRKSDLEKHKMIHSERRPFKCSICNKQFNQSSNMLTHQRRHSGIRPFSCELYGKRFYRKVDVRRHHLVHRVDQHCN